MSPEQAAAEESLDPCSDVYSLACVVYEMLAGEPPYAGSSAVAVLAKQLSEPVPSVRARRDVPEALDDALRRALATAPADRSADVSEFVAALRSALTPGEAEPRIRAPPPRSPRRRRAAALLPGGLLGVAGATVLLWALLGGGWERSARSPPALDAALYAVLPFGYDLDVTRIIGSREP